MFNGAIEVFTRFENKLINNIKACRAFAQRIFEHIHLLYKFIPCFNVSAPLPEVAFSEPEYLKAKILLFVIKAEFAALLFTDFIYNAADALFADLCNGFVARLECFALFVAGFRELNADEFTVSAIFAVKVKDSVSSGA
jgi:hypothetical protein